MGLLGQSRLHVPQEDNQALGINQNTLAVCREDLPGVVHWCLFSSPLFQCVIILNLLGWWYLPVGP